MAQDQGKAVYWCYVDGEHIGPFDTEAEAQAVCDDVQGDWPDADVTVECRYPGLGGEAK